MKFILTLLLLFSINAYLLAQEEAVYIIPEHINLPKYDSQTQVIDNYFSQYLSEGDPFELPRFPKEIIKSISRTSILPNRPFQEDEYSEKRFLKKKSIKRIAYENSQDGIIVFFDQEDNQVLAVKLKNKWGFLKSKSFKLSNIVGHKFKWVTINGRKILKATAGRKTNVMSSGPVQWKSASTLAYIDFEKKHFLIDFVFLSYDYRYHKTFRTKKGLEQLKSEDILELKIKRTDQQDLNINFVELKDKDLIRFSASECKSQILLSGSYKYPYRRYSKSMPIYEKLSVEIWLPKEPCRQLVQYGEYELKDTYFERIE